MLDGSSLLSVALGGSSSIGGCRRSRWVIPAACCARWVIPASMGVAMLYGSSLQKSTAAVLHWSVSPFWWSFSIEMCRHSRCYLCGDDRSQQRLSAVPGGLSLHREVSPCMVGYPCRCQKSTAAVLHWWVSPFWWSFSIEMCRHALWVIPAEVNSCCPPLMGVAIPGVILAEMTGANSGCLLCPVDYPCIGRCRHSGGSSSIEMCRHALWIIPAVFCARWVILASVGVAVLGGSSLQKSTATVLHRWVSLFSMDHPCCLLCSMGHPCIGGCRCSRWIIPAVCCALWVILADARSQ